MKYNSATSKWEPRTDSTTTYTAGSGISITGTTISSTAGASWTASGSDIINTNSGKVGIGTSTPSAKLHVKGDVRIDTLAGTSLRMVVTDPNGVLGSAAIPTAGGSANPPGIIMPYVAATAPAGYLVCDGSAVSRTAYANLYAVIGDAYGYGDGSTTFNLPDFRGVFMRGYDSGRGADPDAGSRGISNSGGNSADGGWSA